MTETGGLLELGTAGDPEANGPPAADQEQGTDSGQPAYLVLARKYRPSTFEDLLGQEVLVRTLTNAFEQGRIAHAFLFVGVRGVGKTTTARIIARGLNCLSSDNPTVRPCGACASCTEALAERHLDILEIDGASHTGVDDVRELTDAAHYRPTTGRYKVYIVDEVHMLSQQAFNALLKTLEEPPAHVVFIFCTTEVRRVPVTVLSRCQRFDLLRVPQELLVEHFRRIVELEAARIDDEALRLIARAADGSVRDGLSILDQAISHQGGVIEAPATRDMLGFADRTLVFDLFERIMAGEAAAALEQLTSLYAAGAEPRVVLEDMLGLTHWLSRICVAPESAEAPEVPEHERTRGRELAEKLSVPVLARTWQMILRALEEAGSAPDSRSAIEMAVIRLCFVADLPDPGALVRRLGAEGAATEADPAPAAAPHRHRRRAGKAAPWRPCPAARRRWPSRPARGRRRPRGRRLPPRSRVSSIGCATASMCAWFMGSRTTFISSGTIPTSGNSNTGCRRGHRRGSSSRSQRTSNAPPGFAGYWRSYNPAGRKPCASSA